jgi:hypothetical protein
MNWAISLPEEMSQRRVVPSVLAERIYFPSGENVSPIISPKCPVNVLIYLPEGN